MCRNIETSWRSNHGSKEGLLYWKKISLFSSFIRYSLSVSIFKRVKIRLITLFLNFVYKRKKHTLFLRQKKFFSFTIYNTGGIFFMSKGVYDIFFPKTFYRPILHNLLFFENEVRWYYFFFTRFTLDYFMFHYL